MLVGAIMDEYDEITQYSSVRSIEIEHSRPSTHMTCLPNFPILVQKLREL